MSKVAPFPKYNVKYCASRLRRLVMFPCASTVTVSKEKAFSISPDNVFNLVGVGVGDRDNSGFSGKSGFCWEEVVRHIFLPKIAIKKLPPIKPAAWMIRRRVQFVDDGCCGCGIIFCDFMFQYIYLSKGFKPMTNRSELTPY